MHIDSLLQQVGEVALHTDEDGDGHERNTRDQQHSLDHLDVGGALHTAEEHVGDHDCTHDSDDNRLGLLVVNIQEHGHQ